MLQMNGGNVDDRYVYTKRDEARIPRNEVITLPCYLVKLSFVDLTSPLFHSRWLSSNARADPHRGRLAHIDLFVLMCC